MISCHLVKLHFVEFLGLPLLGEPRGGRGSPSDLLCTLPMFFVSGVADAASGHGASMKTSLLDLPRHWSGTTSSAVAGSTVQGGSTVAGGAADSVELAVEFGISNWITAT